MSLLPLSRAARKLLIAVGPLGALVGLFIKNPEGLDGIAWTFLAGYGVLAWFLGLSLGYLLHRLFLPKSSESLWSALARLITLR